MRDAFLNKLTQLAAEDRDVVLLTADLGFGVFEEFESTFPGQYFNVGVAEQNMTGLAAGLALEGKKVITYSIGNFPTLRCLEQIRNDACYHDLNITIVASGGGFSYGQLGMSHHTTEDIAIMRALPNITVVAPSNPWEAGEAIEALIKNKGVGYLRLDKTNGSQDNANDNYELGRALKIPSEDNDNDKDVSFFVCGGIIQEVIEAVELLKESKISASIISMHTIKPIDKKSIRDAVKNTKLLVSVEEGNIIGGLGSAISEYCMDYQQIPSDFLRIGLDDKYSSVVGDQAYLRKQYKMDSQYIAKIVQERILKKL
jgi:transketolase